jgi:hypothetical protein
MKEIICEERITITERGRTMLRERRYRGRLDDDGRLRLLGYYEKRTPLSARQAELTPHRTGKGQKTAA